MKVHAFGSLPPVSTLTLGGGGLGMLWRPTTFDECVATVREAVAAGVNLFDLAPRYGDGKAEEVVGAAFAGRLPAGIRVTSKCNLSEQPSDKIEMSPVAQSGHDTPWGADTPCAKRHHCQLLGEGGGVKGHSRCALRRHACTWA